MIKQNVVAFLLAIAIAGCACAMDKITLILDWHINPNHAPIIIAQKIGAFWAANLDVTLVSPSNPSLPPRLVAAKQADLAITYQPQLHFFIEQGLPIVRIGTLIDTPLNTLITLDENIHNLADLEGKKIGFSLSGLEKATLNTMLRHEKLILKDYQMVNVNFQLTSALMMGQVDAIIGGYRNIEALELQCHGKQPIMFNVEDYGIPIYDELIIIANKSSLDESKIHRFLIALKQGVDYLLAFPKESWEIFSHSHPNLDTVFYQLAWQKTLPFFAKDPAQLNIQRYQAYQQFLIENNLISHSYDVSSYALDLS